MEQSPSTGMVEAEPRRTDGYLPIEEYAAIGDGRTLALVGVDGSIDWMCLPDLDGPSLFAALLDPVDGGSFSLVPAVGYDAKRSYVPQTNVLQTEFVTAQGTARVTEAVTLDTSQNAPWRELLRQVEGVSGSVPMEWRLRPRFGYGQRPCDPIRSSGGLVYRYEELQVGLRCWGAGQPQVSGEVISGAFEIQPGQTATLALVASDEVALPMPDRLDLERRLQATIQLWRTWVTRSTYQGPWKEAVERSLLAIRLLADARTGAITAAGTTSLPEVVGGQRNYDYRFAWTRDLSFTVDALLRVGMKELAHASVTWLLAAVGKTHPRIDPVYGLTGDVVRSQVKLPMPGYRGSSPVYLGNKAGSQLQLGGFGDLVETLWRYADSGHVLSRTTAERIADCADLLCAIWPNQDAGLWELDDFAHYATSKIGCWTALERLLDLVGREHVPPRHVSRWRAERARIREFIENHLWSDGQRSYVMKAGSDLLDCGVLLASRRKYTDPAGPRMKGTIDAINAQLHAEGPLFYRYSGMQEEENAFLACSFWMVEALALAHRQDEAAELMNGMVSVANDLGLYGEQMEPGTHAMRGNFPQALTHLALISAADILQQQEQAETR